MKQVMAREGDFIESSDRLIFDVKGLVQPPNRVVAFIRYVPDPNGDRRRNKEAYRKVYPLAERYELLRKKYPMYIVFDHVFGECIGEVPIRDIKRHYDPSTKLGELQKSRDLDPVEATALDFIEFLKEWTGIAWNKLGISGSILVGMHSSNSDIDVIVYGTENGLCAYETLRKRFTVKQLELQAYATGDLKQLYEARKEDTVMRWNEFLKTERRKILQGKFRGRDFFIRLVKDWDEVKERYGDIHYTSVGYARIVARITDDSDAIFTPCRYGIDSIKVLKGRKIEPLKEIVSFRGRFCEQARLGEKVEAQGKIEKVQPKNSPAYYRLLLGGKPTDYMAIG